MATSELSKEMLETGETVLMIIPKKLALSFLKLCRAYYTNYFNMQSLTLGERSLFADVSGRQRSCLENCEEAR